jgi:PAS domain-containing protein
MKRAQRQARRSPLRGGGVDLTSIVAAAPVPAFVFTGARVIAAVNPALESWTGQPATSLEGAPLAQIFRIRFRQPDADPWRALADDTVDRLDGSIAYMPPGRVLVRPIHACRIALDGPPDFACLVFVG